MADTYDSVTEPLKNGAALPSHPDDTTAKEITSYGSVYDADDGTQLVAGLHRNEVSVLVGGQPILEHAYRYAILTHNGAKRIFHTRKSVVIHVKTNPITDVTA